MVTILTPLLMRTLGLREAARSRTPDLKPSSVPSLRVAGLQASATTPGVGAPCHKEQGRGVNGRRSQTKAGLTMMDGVHSWPLCDPFTIVNPRPWERRRLGAA
ncbi:hypothetical protein M514_19576 [Trichuris suis]|uniref:Uncharacterized protein n=1 Tax=Trichuris suis TaxID=68888 RepID=A0A085NFR8_9BILA|nr:hypothetical protein M514_19576 [Trichuris suis]